MLHCLISKRAALLNLNACCTALSQSVLHC
jgi:hypothetical protein